MKPQKTRPANEPARPRPLPSSWPQDWLLGLFLVLATLIAYVPALHAGFVWDDDAYVTQDPLLTAPDGLHRIWFSLDSPAQYFPLTYTMFYLEHSLWGLDPAGYHWVNILLHAANALLAWRMLAWLRVPGAWLAAAIFALHPVQVESVAWVSECKNLLMVFFFLLTLLAWMKFIDEQCKRPWRFYVLALIFYALSLSAKTTACTLPAALLLILWLKKMPINWRRFGQVVPFVAMGIGMGLVTVWWERRHQGAQPMLFEIGPLERVLIASRAIWFYAGKLLWPANLIISYPHWTISASDPRAYGWLLATAALGLVIWRVRRWTGRSVEVAAAFFVVTLSPVLGFIMLYTFVYSFVADHYQYLACLGLIALAAAGMKMELDRLAAGKRVLQPALAAALLMTLGALTWKQCGMYANAETLWQTTFRLNPNSWMAHNNFGTALLQKGKPDEAMAHFQKALEMNPDYAEAHFGLGNSYSQLGRKDEAMAQFQKAVEINPNYARAHNNLGLCLFQQGRMDEAISHYRTALELQPDYAEAHYNLGLCLDQQGRKDEAMAQFQKAFETKPDLVQAHNSLGNLLLGEGKVDEAIAQYQATLQADSGNAEGHFDIGIAFLKKGNMAEAIAHFQKALQIAPANPQIQITLAWLLATGPQASLRNGEKAVELAQQANAQTGAKDPVILHTLAAAFAEAGRFSEALETAQRALRLAGAQSNTGLAGQLQLEMKLYQAGNPFHGSVQTP